MISKLNEEQVVAVFASRKKEFDVLVGLLKLAIPDWDEVEYILEGKPRIGEAGWRTIYDLFVKFNEEHPGENIFPGALWLSMGFAMDNSLEDWQIDTSEMKFILKPQT